MKSYFHRGLGFIVLTLVASALANSQPEAPLIPRRAIFSDADKSLVRLSPDGSRISFLARVEGLSNIWVGPVADPTQAGPVTKLADSSVITYQWAYTNQQIIYLQRASQGIHLFALDLANGQIRDLTPIENVSARIEKLSPDHPEEILIALNNRDPRRFDLHRINVRTGAMKLIVKNDEYDRFLCDDELRPRIARRDTAEGGYELFKLNADGQWSLFDKLTYEDARVTQPVALDKSGRLLYMIDNRQTDTGVLNAVNLETKKATTLVSDPLADLLPVLMIHPKTSRVQSATAAYGRTRRHFLDRSMEADFTYLSTVHTGDVGVAGRSLDDRIWLAVFQDGGPLRYYAYDRKAKRARFLFTDYQALDGVSLARREAVVITTRDGLQLPADLYLPSWSRPGKNRYPDKPLPMLVYVHGGPSVAYPWNSWFTNRVLQLLANRGYAVFRVEFRGAAGLGKKILLAGAREWGGQMQNDVLDAVEWAVDQGITERSRVGIFGWSYGGYATLAALTLTPDAFACGLAMYPVSDLVDMMETRNPSYFREFWRRQVGDESTKAGRAFLKSRSPVHLAGQIRRPLLITHGARDAVVSRSHSDAFIAEMKKHEKPVTYLLYPDEGHDYARKENWASLFAVAERFFHEHLGGRFEPVGDDLIGSSMEVVEGGQLIPGFTEASRASRAQTRPSPPGEAR